MKFVALILLLLSLYCSWSITKAPTDMPVLKHVQLQAEMQDFIADYITQNLPQSKNIVFHSVYTEPLSHALIKVVFNYSFENTENTGEIVKSQLKGAVLLTKDQPQEGTWQITKIEINNQVIEFENGSVITPSPTTSE